MTTLSDYEYFRTPRGVLYCGPCETVMPMLEKVDLVVTSPPYGTLRDYDGYTFNFYQTAWQIKRILKDGAVCVWVVGDETKNGSESGDSFRQALFFKAIGLNLHDTMIWNKGCFTSPQVVRYPNSFEYMFIVSKGTMAFCNQIKDRKNKKAGSSSIHTIRKRDGKTRNTYSDCRKTTIFNVGVRFNVWDIYPEQSSKNRVHPAIFPEKLAQDHIISWSNPGDIVCDPMAGSGTVAKMADRLNRRWICIEISETYCKISKARLELELSQPRLPGGF